MWTPFLHTGWTRLVRLVHFGFMALTSHAVLIKETVQVFNYMIEKFEKVDILFVLSKCECSLVSMHVEVQHMLVRLGLCSESSRAGVGREETVHEHGHPRRVEARAGAR